MMYLPSFWFHYIISQDASIQCNTRSGEALEGKREIDECGFSKRSSSSSSQNRRKRDTDDKEEHESHKKKDYLKNDEPETNGDNMSELHKSQRKRRNKRSKKDRIEWSMQS